MGCKSSTSLDTASNNTTQNTDTTTTPLTHSNSALPGPSSSPLSPYQQELVGAARWPDDSPQPSNTDKPHSAKVSDHSIKMYTKAREAGSLIAYGQIDCFDALWEYATRWKLSTLNRGNPAYNAFASKRTSGTRFITLIEGPYQCLESRLLNHKAVSNEIMDHHLLGKTRVNVYRQQGDIHGTLIEMTVISVATNANELSYNLQALAKNFGKERAADVVKSDHPNRIEHTNASYLPTIRNHLNQLFSQTINPSLNASQAFDLIARIHWWAASTAPDKRGNAEKSEFVARAMANAHGIELPPFTYGTIPHIEAMLSSEKEFVETYKSLLDYESKQMELTGS